MFIGLIDLHVQMFMVHSVGEPKCADNFGVSAKHFVLFDLESLLL